MFLAAVFIYHKGQTAGVFELFGVIFCRGIQSCTIMSVNTQACFSCSLLLASAHTQLPVTVSFPFHLSLYLSPPTLRHIYDIIEAAIQAHIIIRHNVHCILLYVRKQIYKMKIFQEILQHSPSSFASLASKKDPI